jgi:DNA-binding CsgD family transcriptional regulator
MNDERQTLQALLRDLRASGLHPVVLYELRGEGDIAVVAVADETPAAVPATAPYPAGWHRLTDRERAVARLAGQACTNQQIARRLDISTHTVNYHLRQIFRKLAISSRVSLAAYTDGDAGQQTPHHRGPAMTARNPGVPQEKSADR